MAVNVGDDVEIGDLVLREGWTQLPNTYMELSGSEFYCFASTTPSNSLYALWAKKWGIPPLDSKVCIYDAQELPPNSALGKFLQANGVSTYSCDNPPPVARPARRNNDGLSECCQCHAPTKKVALFLSVADVCTKCGY